MQSIADGIHEGNEWGIFSICFEISACLLGLILIAIVSRMQSQAGKLMPVATLFRFPLFACFHHDC